MTIYSTAVHLSQGAVHFWQIDLSYDRKRVEVCRRLLSKDETERADRFHLEKHRARFIAARGAMRMILALYADLQPHQVRFFYGTNGKPEMAADLNNCELKFNLSHSRDRALFAVAARSRVGVDIEFIDHNVATEYIARRYFSSGEVRTLRALPAPQQAVAFFSCWTRKEAYTKAVGEGLSLALDSFEVAFMPELSASLVRTHACPDDRSQWRIYDIPTTQDYAAAIAVEGTNHNLQQQQWDWPP